VNQRAFWPFLVSAYAVRMNFDACARSAPRFSRSAVTVMVSAGKGWASAALADMIERRQRSARMMQR
jgi:hypothetical protein